MRHSIAFAAIAAAPLAMAGLQTATSGGAKIINYCADDILLQNVPAMGSSSIENGQESTATLKGGNVGSASTYFTSWIALDPSVQGGWSMKLNTLGNWNNIMQYEYTWKGAGTQIWYDMSFVNGLESDHPAWEFTSPGLSPTHNSYQYSTDDTNGMQTPIDPTATMTLLLCPPGSGSSASTASSAASSAPSVASSVPSVVSSASSVVSSASAPSTTAAAPAPSTTSAAPSTTSAAPPPSSAAPSSTTSVAPPPSTTTPAPTTLQTSAAPTNPSKLIIPGIAADIVNAAGPEIVTEYATVVVTVLATETASAHAKRHAHKHPHGPH